MFVEFVLDLEPIEVGLEGLTVEGSKVEWVDFHLVFLDRVGGENQIGQLESNLRGWGLWRRLSFGWGASQFPEEEEGVDFELAPMESLLIWGGRAGFEPGLDLFEVQGVTGEPVAIDSASQDQANMGSRDFVTDGVFLDVALRTGGLDPSVAFDSLEGTIGWGEIRGDAEITGAPDELDEITDGDGSCSGLAGSGGTHDGYGEGGAGERGERLRAGSCLGRGTA